METQHRHPLPKFSTTHWKGEENPRAIHPPDVLVILNTNSPIACYKVLTQDGAVIWHIPD